MASKGMFDWAAFWPLWPIAAMIAAIAGCPPINRPTCIQHQASEWKWETVTHFNVSATNGLDVVEEGGLDDPGCSR